ncbi:TPA: CRISPR system precrRNA processing endoribonuclease RAMP protein Cas6 [Mannheimia haemolytica]
MLLQNFPLARYRLQFVVSEPFSLPEYAGSALRGVFGRSLRRIACMTKQKDCQGCPLYRSCPYTNIFETPAPVAHSVQKFSQAPNGYIIEPLEWGERNYMVGDVFAFDLVLFGRLISQLALIVFAFKRGLEYNLAGGKATLRDVCFEGQSILKNGIITEHLAQITLPPFLPNSVEIELDTPLRLQNDGVPLNESYIHKERLFIGLAKRLALLSEFHHQPIMLDFDQIKQDIQQVKDDKNLYWQDWTRYSSRQKQKMHLGGVMGGWRFEQLSPMLANLLYIGQWIHCGKNATFGLGKYRIITI